MRHKIRRLTDLLREAAPHVYRQQFAGKHEQDRDDAMQLYPRIMEELK